VRSEVKKKLIARGNTKGSTGTSEREREGGENKGGGKKGGAKEKKVNKKKEIMNHISPRKREEKKKIVTRKRVGNGTVRSF